MTRQRVISYTRFSSRKQAKGDSLRRQTSSAAEWCKRHGYELDTSLALADLGISGYTGANAKSGALGALLELCKAGKIQLGTILLIEAFDRLTRLPLPDAVSLLLNLVRTGLVIVTLTDDKRWDRNSLSDLSEFLVSILTLYRGHQESEYKSKQLKATFAEHRRKCSRQAFGSAPGWLYRNSKDTEWLVDEEKAEVVRKAFHLAGTGYGSKAIAKVANEASWPVPTRLNQTEGRWHAQMPGQLLRNRAVLGEHEHRIRTHEANADHWRGRSTGMVIPDYYPRIVSDDLWNKARASIETRRVDKRRDDNYWNVWSGLLYCGFCGAPMQRKSESRGQSRGSIVCSDNLAGKTTCPPMSVNRLDLPLLDEIYRLCLSFDKTPGDGREAEIAGLEARQRELNTVSERLVEAVASTSTPVKALADKIEQISQEMHKVRVKLQEIQQVRELANTDLFEDESYLRHAKEHLYEKAEESREIRAALHLSMARLVDTIWVFSYEMAIVRLKDAGGLQHLVPLPHKQLPSRSNPAAKYHKPVPPQEPPHKPNYEKALMGRLVLPTPRRNGGALQNKTAPYLLDADS